MSPRFNEDEVIKQYDDFLDDIYPEVKLGNLSFMPSTIIKELDPIAYRTGMSDFMDSLES